MKKLTVMLLIAAMVLGVSACGNSANKGNTATESQMSTQEAEDLDAKINELTQKENSILENHKALWEKVFNSIDKSTVEDATATNYGDFLANSLDKIKDKFTDDELKSLKEDVEEIKKLEDELQPLLEKQSVYTMSAKMCRDWGVSGIVTKSEQLGKAIRSIKEGLIDTTTEQRFLELTGGCRLFSGKVIDVLRETRGAFNFGKVVLEGIGSDKQHEAYVEYQNENLQCVVDGETLATAPDLICLVDHDTYIPVPNEAVKYGKRVLVVGLPCAPQWRSEAGLELVGPRYFGIDTEYIPVEERSKRKGE